MMKVKHSFKQLCSWPWHVFTLEMRKFLAYRVDFWVNFFGTTLFNLLVSYFLWQAVFTATKAQELKGMSFSYMFFYSLLAPLCSRVIGQGEFGNISTEIYQGGLTKYLLYPLSFLKYMYVGQMARATFALFQLIFMITLFVLAFGLPDRTMISWTTPVYALGALFLASTLYYLLSASLEMVSFFADNTWSLLVMLRMISGILGGVYFPLTLFPEWGQKLLFFLPFSCLIHFPVKSLTGELTGLEWGQTALVSLFWIGMAWGICKQVWKKGSFEYTGVGI